MFSVVQRAVRGWRRGARGVAQFRVNRSDCCEQRPPRRVHDPHACAPRDAGLVLGVYRNDALPAAAATALTAAARAYDCRVRGKLGKLLKLASAPGPGEARVFYDVDPEHAFVAVAGLGSECVAPGGHEGRDEAAEAARVAAAAGVRALLPLRPRELRVESFGRAEAAAEGAALAAWRFDEYRSAPRVPPPALRLHDDCDELGWRSGRLKAEAQNLARHLQEMPANLLNPTEFAKICVELLCELDINVEVRTAGWAAARDMGGLASLGRSSVQPPLYVEASYYGAGAGERPVVLVGKGVTFNSGSLALKSREELRHMRGDMAGAAAAVGALRAAARLQLPLNLRAILPLCEVMPNGRSPRSGDVVRAGDGCSVRLRQPSRESRLLLADSLVHARSYWPRCIVDVGTMSQELAATLGGAACGCYCNSERLFALLEAAGAATGDRLWRMPLWGYYAARVRDTSTADLASSARHRYGDSPHCAAYLRQFVCDSAWAHLDIHNVAYTRGADCVYLPRGMTGRPTRTLIQLLYNLIADPKL
ncbi:cytosol aminopeptidase-like [Plutella xylostella]|uniref:cytosol aminopeptidase-like n=1 Tax=Plutella xylostella TaxID=51655 RepID=UPI002032309D|nr:cytosol aminopeptidase-like [Plutella xylostella]